MTYTEASLKEALEKKLQDISVDILVKRSKRIIITTSRENLKKIAKLLFEEFSSQHLSTITARDTGTSFEVQYHFIIDTIMVTIKITCPRDDPTVDSIVSLFPSAILYEREIHDLLGIIPLNHPDLRRLVLPDHWSEGFPLRKDWKPAGGET